MADTYAMIHIHLIFTVKDWHNWLQKPWRDEVFKYHSGIIKNKGHKPIIVNGVRDNMHCFIGLKPAMAISDLVRDIRNNSTNLIHS